MYMMDESNDVSQGLFFGDDPSENNPFAGVINNEVMPAYDKWSVKKAAKDVSEASKTMNDVEARFMVDTYYSMQKSRIRTSNQLSAIYKPYNDWVAKWNKAIKNQIPEEELKALEAEKPVIEPHQTLLHFYNNYSLIENDIKNCLKKYAEEQQIGQWMMSILGIGPVIAAGLIAHIDIDKVTTCGQIQAFGGLDPTKKWVKGQKRPWNAALKVLYWKIGQSFIKVQNNPNDFYGKYYQKRKEYEEAKNERLEYKEQADYILATKTFSNTPVAQEMKRIYEEGKLPPQHITQRCARYATKLFLSHLFAVWKFYKGEYPPMPWVLVFGGHVDHIAIPNCPAGFKYRETVLRDWNKNPAPNMYEIKE